MPVSRETSSIRCVGARVQVGRDRVAAAPQLLRAIGLVAAQCADRFPAENRPGRARARGDIRRCAYSSRDREPAAGRRHDVGRVRCVRRGPQLSSRVADRATIGGYARRHRRPTTSPSAQSPCAPRGVCVEGVWPHQIDRRRASSVGPKTAESTWVAEGPHSRARGRGCLAVPSGAVSGIRTPRRVRTRMGTSPRWQAAVFLSCSRGSAPG